MHASNAFLNGATLAPGRNEILRRALMATAGNPADPAKRRDQQQGEAERSAPSKNQPGSFQNDPDDGSNPNEVRERHNEQVKPS